MSKRNLPNTYLISLIHLDKSQNTPLYWQIYHSLRQAILTSKLGGGVKLPSSRDLANLLQTSRTTIVNAYDQLLAEGYLVSQVGAGTFVAKSLPEAFMEIHAPENSPPQQAFERPLSSFGQKALERGKQYNLKHVHPFRDRHTFHVGMPDLNEFPFAIWSRLANHHLRHQPAKMFQGNKSTAGYPPLREAIADYVQIARATNCSPEQIIIVSGAQQALYLSAQVLLSPNDTVWVEDPCYLSGIGALDGTGARIVPVPVDEEGLMMAQGQQLAPNARLVCVTPSCQFPLGYTMSLPRRLSLLAWAAKSGAWILEDDYDSEFRYDGSPLASLQGLDNHQRVIYIGTFSKMMYPSLRLGYLVVPPDLVDAFLYARIIMDQYTPRLEQLMLTDFMTQGYFTRHLRKMRKLYGERCRVLQMALAKYCADWVDVGDVSGGMHLVAWLKNGLDDKRVAAEAVKYNLRLSPLSSTYIGQAPARGGLMLGFTAMTLDEIETAVIKLAQLLSDITHNTHS